MSPAAPAAARPGAGRGPARPQLHLVPAPNRRPARAPFAFLVGAVLLAGLVSLLMLNTLSAQDAFRLQDLQKRTATLAEQEQALQLAVQTESSPTVLAERAAALGMFPGGPVTFVRLADGRLVGLVTALPPPPPPAPVAKAPTAKSKATAKHPATRVGSRRRATTTRSR